MPNAEKEHVCMFCNRWRESMIYSDIVKNWADRECVFALRDSRPDDDFVKIFVAAMGFDFADKKSEQERICEYCGEGEAIGNLDDREICPMCWNKIKP